ncbi:hypothetical protein MHYP_G00041270 [Metynnis hypsauchen]
MPLAFPDSAEEFEAVLGPHSFIIPFSGFLSQDIRSKRIRADLLPSFYCRIISTTNIDNNQGAIHVHLQGFASDHLTDGSFLGPIEEQYLSPSLSLAAPPSCEILQWLDEPILRRRGCFCPSEQAAQPASLLHCNTVQLVGENKVLNISDVPFSGFLHCKWRNHVVVEAARQYNLNSWSS